MLHLESETAIEDREEFEPVRRLEPTAFDHESSSLWLRLRRTTRSVVDAVSQELAERDMTLADFDTLAALYRQAPPRSLTISALARATARSHGSVSVHIERLNRRGLVSRLAVREDRRLSRVRMTPKGAALMEQLMPSLVERQVASFSVFTADERRTFDALLRKLWANRSTDD